MRALIALMAASVAMSSTWAQEIDEERIADLMATPFAARSNIWTCRPIARYVCGADGCDSAPALVSVKLDFAAGTYARCDAKGCDTYVIDRTSWGGVFSHVTVTRGSCSRSRTMAPLTPRSPTAGLVSHVNHGRCEPY